MCDTNWQRVCTLQETLNYMYNRSLTNVRELMYMLRLRAADTLLGDLQYNTSLFFQIVVYTRAIGGVRSSSLDTTAMYLAQE
jgi:hypothetical protein